ncbi:sigma-54-dependent Fis family transcriptional regulator [Candidatus Ozemobacteraceae bacterium]|nr:sigma-54-dependent Fis family transcriptional regulator [Candidatus Ozemobacteraceae bacterium]
MPNRIVLIDDEVKLLRALKKALELDGHEVCDFSQPDAALQYIIERNPALVISDIRMPGMSGLDLLAKLGKLHPRPPCILMTAYSSIETAVTAVKLGARDYLLKPFEIADLRAAVRSVLAAEHAGSKISAASSVAPAGHSEAIRSVLDMIDRVADTESTVLLQGESGTGKELAARTLHARSRRSSGPFIPVNCSAIPENLVESELFGHVKGSFTGAISDKDGLFHEASGGTLFLDEIGDLAQPSQAKLLRVLQDGVVRKVGDTRAFPVNVRIVAASNRDLRAESMAGRFREDLLYRLSVVEIRMPPLREHPEDIPDLVNVFLRRFAERHHRPILTPSGAALTQLTTHSWPGNVRELENVIERAVILKRIGEELLPEDLPLPTTPSGRGEGVSAISEGMPLDTAREQLEVEMIRRALETAGYNYSQAADILGVTRQNLHYKLKKYGLRKGPDRP